MDLPTRVSKSTAIVPCDLCRTKTAKYDAPTIMRPWAHMCTKCMRAYGVGGPIGSIININGD